MKNQENVQLEEIFLSAQSFFMLFPEIILSGDLNVENYKLDMEKYFYLKNQQVVGKQSKSGLYRIQSRGDQFYYQITATEAEMKDMLIAIKSIDGYEDSYMTGNIDNNKTIKITPAKDHILRKLVSYRELAKAMACLERVCDNKTKTINNK